MATTLGRQLGTRLGTELADLTKAQWTEAVADARVAATAPFAWLRPDSHNAASGTVTAFVDKYRGGHLFSQGTVGNQVPVPTADATFNGKVTARFLAASAHRYVSNLTSTLWNFTHMGTGCEIVIAAAFTSTSGPMLQTRRQATAAEVGFYLGYSGANFQSSIGNGTANQTRSAITMASYKAPLWATWRHATAQSPDIQFGIQTAIATFTGDYAFTPAGATPQQNISLGGRVDGTQSSDMRWADLIIYDRVLTDSERGVIASYMAARYKL